MSLAETANVTSARVVMLRIPQAIAREDWERRWLQLTGRPWGWEPPKAPMLKVSLGSRADCLDTRIWLEDLPLHRLVRDLEVRKRVGEVPTLTLTIPLNLVELVP